MSDILDSTSENILAGHFSEDDFPVIPAKIVKVYLSAAGNDTLTERNLLMNEAYPRLREFCRNTYHLEFQVVDLEWGLPPNQLPLDLDLYEFRRKAIRRCQEEGVGPSLVILFSQKYGRSPLPVSILANEFEAIRVTLHQHRGRETRKAGLLDDWFSRDDNNLPPVYTRKHVTEMIPDIENADQTIRARAESTWKDTEKTLLFLLARGAELSYLRGTLDSDRKRDYSMSEQEGDIEFGLAGCDSPSLRCVVINRNIVDLNNYIEDPRATRFTEVTYNEKTEELEVDELCRTRLPRLTKRVRELVPSNTMSYDVLWRYDDVISPNLHRKYLESLRDDFCSHMSRLVEADLPNCRLNMTDSVHEVYKHWVMCRQLASHFCSQEQVLLEAQNYLQESSNAPLVIHGPVGSGKTTLLSKLAIMTHDLLGDATLTVLRYVGMTPNSLDLPSIMKTMCHQVYTCWGGNERVAITLNGRGARTCFYELITSVPPEKLLVVYLDNVDDLPCEGYAEQLTWLPNRLPHNVKVILTINSRNMDLLQKHQENPDVSPSRNLDLKSLTPSQCEQLFLQILSKSGRTVTEEQLDIYKQIFPSCPLPIFIKLLSCEARRLKSCCCMTDMKFPTDGWSAIHQFFDQLEDVHGRALVTHAMALHCASGWGLSDCEMEDVLSLDEDLLNAVYTEYHPEVRRIPPHAWVRLKEDLSDFLFTQEVNGVTVTTWGSRMFQIITQERYHCFEENIKEAHSVLADYFLGTWANRDKPVKLPSDQSVDVCLPCGDKADRKVPSQPLIFKSDSGPLFYNKRKYEYLPRHLVLSGRLTEMNERVLFNYDWLYTKIKGLSLQHVLADFTLNPGEEARLVEEALRAAEPVLSRDINNLAPELTGHLLPYYTTHAHVRRLLQQCDTVGLQHCALIPNFPYLKIPGGPLQHTLQPPERPDCFVLSKVRRSLLTKLVDSSYVYTYDLDTGRITSKVFASSGELHLTPDGVFLVIVDHETEKAIKIHRSNSGEFVGQIIIENHLHLKPGDKCKNGPMCLTSERLIATMSTDVGYLCIADIATCQMLQIIELEGRISVCAISHDLHYIVCNSDTLLMSYDLDTLHSVAAIQLGVRPDAIAVTKDGLRCFLSNRKEGKLYNIHLDGGHFDLIYKINLEEELLGDPIQDIRLSPNDDLVLIRADNTILVHDRTNENIRAQLIRPPDVPKEFRLPKSHYTPVVYTQAEFSQDGQLVIATIFRKIYVWKSWTGEIVTSTDAPVGIISRLLVSTNHDKVVTHTEHSSEILVWNVTKCIHKLTTLDKLSGPIADIQVTGDSSVAYIRCQDSDEVGVIDIHRGVLLDLLTHEQKLFDLASTPSGGFLLVSMSPHLRDTATKIWDIAERKVIREFGNVPGYCISMNTCDDLIFVGQKDQTFRSPYHVTLFHFVGDTFLQTEHDRGLPNVTMKPCMTTNDRFLVVVSRRHSDQSSGSRSAPSLCVFDMDRRLSLSYYTAEKLGLKLIDILYVKRCPLLEDAVAVVYSTPPPDTATDGLQTEAATPPPDTSSYFGFFILRLTNGHLERTCPPFACTDPLWADSAVFATDFSFYLDSQSYVRDLSTGDCITCLPNPGSPPRLLALNNSVVVYFSHTRLVTVRLADGLALADCDVHGTPCHVTLGTDSRTVITGCTNGAIVSHVVINPAVDDISCIIKSLKSRQLTSGSEEDGRATARSWDRVDSESCPEYSRPPSVVKQRPRDMVLLIEIQSVPRPRSQLDSLLYVNPKSQICSIM